MSRLGFAIPGDLAMLTGGYGYDRELIAHLPACGVEVGHLRLPDGFPFPSVQVLEAALHQLASAQHFDALLIDGLAFGVLPADELAKLRVPLIALVHHPLGLESGLTAEQSAQLVSRERAALTQSQHVIVTSQTTGETLVADFRVPQDHITVALPGIRPVERATGSGGTGVALLAVGAVIARKAYDTLVEALAHLKDLHWSLTIIGSLDRDPDRVEALQAQIVSAGLDDRVTLSGEASGEGLDTAFRQSDLFVLASHYEGYGMVLAEALSYGLPIVTSTGGASAKTAPDGAALKVPPGDPSALASALRRAISDRGLRKVMAQESWEAGQTLPRWQETAQVVARVVQQVRGLQP